MRLFVRYERRVYGLVLAMVGNLADADDVMQEATAVMWRKFDEFEPGSDFASWALSIGRFQAMAHRKKKAVARTRLSDRTVDVIADELAGDADRDDERREALRKCLAKLKDEDRKLVELRYEPDATTKSVAEQSGRSIHAVYKALNRIHGALLRCVRQTMAAEGIHLRG
jgi:RNA polymerase sigma-70 factor, ECF subfamily